MGLYNAICILIVLSAAFAYVNYRFLRFPSAIGVMLIALFVSIVLVITGRFFPEVFYNADKIVGAVNFRAVLMNALLSFLLFAGAIQIRLRELQEHRLSVILFSTISVIISTFIVGGLFYYILPFTGLTVPFVECLLFGALISPTDPVAVLGIIRKAGVSRAVETRIAGEALFNDGITIVLFLVLIGLAQHQGPVSPGEVVLLFIREAVGGFGLGLILGYIGMQGLKNIDNYQVEMMITLAIVMGGYSLASILGVSGPITMVIAGIIIGNQGEAVLASDQTRDYLEKFWELIDEILNAVLFILIGFQLLLIKDFTGYLIPGFAAIVVALIARYFAIWIPSLMIRFRERMSQRTIGIMVWGGLRGGISVALALALDRDMHKDLFVSVTYMVVIFSIIVQGLTIGKLAKVKEEDTVSEDMPYDA